LNKKYFVTAAFGLLFVFTVSAQKREEDYRAIFSNDYDQAILFLQKEKWMTESIQKHGLNSKEVFAIVFPELIRYNSIQDKVETFALETLYVQFGKDYANFSIGQFQIKPSFAENVEKDFINLFGLKESHLLSSDTLQTEDKRSRRVQRLKDKSWALDYLCMYFKVVTTRYPELKNEAERIKFFACAYNCGFQKSKKEIETYLPKRFFHKGITATVKYCYADIAWYYFQQP